MLPYQLLRASTRLLAGAPSSPHLLASSPRLLSSPHLLHTAAPAPQAQGEVARWGPDRLLPANSLTTSWPDGRVELRTHPHPSSDYPTMSVWTMLHQTAARVPDRTALAVKRDGVWMKWSYAEYLHQVKCLAKAYIHLGLQRSHSVCIIGFNAPEWHISSLAAVVAGGLATGIYTTNSTEAVRYVAEHSRANIIVLETQEHLAKVAPWRDTVPSLEAVVQWGGQPSDGDSVLVWQDLIKLGASLPDDALEERLAQQATNQPCMLVYTSGTTGQPKGVMMSQDNLTWTVRAAQETYDWNWDKEEGISYLPLSHVAAQIIDIYLTAYGGATVWFADDQALQGSLIHTLKEVRPTRFFGVPRVWEKIQEKMMEVGRQNTGARRAVAEWAKGAALRHHQERMAGRPGGGLSYWLARTIILSRVHAALGLERAADPNTGGFYSSAAPLSPQTSQYFQSLDMPIMELLGSSESGGPQTACLKGPGMRAGSVGRGYPHFETAILNPGPSGVGEICTRGRNVFVGYLWDEEKTREVVDAEGWVHSGDLGWQDQDGFFYVSGRMKEILITGGGENVAPVPIEEGIKAELGEVVSQAMVVGDRRKHLAVLLTLRTELDPRGQPTLALHPEVLAWLRARGSQSTSTLELIEEDNMEVRAALQGAIDRCNQMSVSKAAHVRKFLLLPADFSLAGGELTPTLKVKRHAVLEKYGGQIEEMYQHETLSSMW